MIKEAIERIEKMEQHFDAAKDSDSIESLLILRDYCDSGLWLKDYELDEKGLLPKTLKRGVLSQDGLYDLLCEKMNEDLEFFN